MSDDEEEVEELLKEEEQRPPESVELFLAKLHTAIQRTRVKGQVRCAHLKRQGKDDRTTAAITAKIHAIEKDIVHEIQKSVEAWKPWVDWGKHVKGLGAFSMGKLRGMIDIEKDVTVSKLWRFAGQKPGEEWKKGEKLHYNKNLKSLCWRIGGNLLKAKGSYYLYYCAQKKYYQDRAQYQGITIVPAHKGKEPEGEIYEGHIHLMAQRKMVKLFLSHLWQVWRTAEGYPVTEPYSLSKMGGHQTFYDPYEFVNGKSMEIVKPVKV